MRPPGRVARASPVGGGLRVGEAAREAVGVGHQAVPRQDVRPEHAALVVRGVEVVGGSRHHDAVAPRVLDRLVHEARVAEVGRHRGDDAGARVDRKQPGLGQVVVAVERLRARLDRQQQAPGAQARALHAVVGLRGGLLLLAVGVAVGGVVGGGIVLVVVEVPARDVVRVAVAVVVDGEHGVAIGAVLLIAGVEAELAEAAGGPIVAGEGGDHVLGVDQTVAVEVADAAVLLVVGGVEDPIAVRVVGARIRARAAVAQRWRQLAPVQVDLFRQLLGVAVVPVDAALDVRDHHVGRSDGARAEVAPGGRDGHPARVLGVHRLRRALRHEAVEVELLVVDRLARAGAREARLHRLVVGVVGRRWGAAGRPAGAERASRRQDSRE